jgi:hypothetical protein
MVMKKKDKPNCTHDSRYCVNVIEENGKFYGICHNEKSDYYCHRVSQDDNCELLDDTEI